MNYSSCDSGRKSIDTKEVSVRRRSIIFALSFILVSSLAYAQASRTWVSGVGDDVNPCSRTAPCKTFAGAISKTASGGEIDALDPGGFGALTITKPITIDGNNWGSVLVSGGTSGIIVASSTAGEVILRNLSIDGIGQGLTGIRIIGTAAQRVRIEHVKVFNFTSDAVLISPNSPGTADVAIVDSSLLNSGPVGVDLQGTGGTALATLAMNNTLVTNSSTGIHVQIGNKAVIANCVITNNATWGLVADGANSTASIYSTVFAYNGTAVQSGQMGFGGAIVSLSKNQFIGNGTALVNSGSTLNSHQDNAIDGNLGSVPAGIGQQ